MSVKNKIAKFIVGVMVLTGLMGTAVFAASSPTSVTIYTNDTSATSTGIYCSSYIDGFGVNDKTSTNNLYYTLRFKETVGTSEAYSQLMVPGTGSMGPSSVNTWSTLFTQKTVMSGPGTYSIKLNPQGALKTGCYGAGKLVD